MIIYFLLLWKWLKQIEKQEAQYILSHSASKVPA